MMFSAELAVLTGLCFRQERFGVQMRLQVRDAEVPLEAGDGSDACREVSPAFLFAGGIAGAACSMRGRRTIYDLRG